MNDNESSLLDYLFAVGIIMFCLSCGFGLAILFGMMFL